MKRTWIRPFAVALLLTGTWAVAAEPGEAGSQQAAKHMESRKLLEEVMMARLTRELALEDGQTLLLLRHLTEFRDRMAALRRARGEKMRDLREAVQEGKDEKKIGVLMEKVLALNERTARARNKVLDFEGFELTTWQRARLLLFLNDFEGDMRRLLRRAQDRRANHPDRRRGGYWPEVPDADVPPPDRPAAAPSPGADTETPAPAIP